jgi:peroxiredoxin
MVPMFRKLAVFLIMLGIAFAKFPRPLPDVAISMPDGKKLPIKQYRGKMVAVVLFSTTCADCLKSIELMSKFQKEFGPRGFQALGAAVNMDAPDQIRGFIDRYRPGFPVGLLDRPTTYKLADFGEQERPFVPILIFIDARQTIRFQYYGNDPIMPQQEKATRAIIDSLLKSTGL